MKKKIAVFRGLFLGDLVAATSALRALRRGYPGAEISLVTLPWATALAPHLWPSVDRVIPYPGAPGLDGPSGDPPGLERFVEEMRAERLDLVVNLHGKGPESTRLVARFGAHRVAAFVLEESGVPTPDVSVSWDTEEHESAKLLRLAEAAGGKPDGYGPGLRVRAEDLARALALVPEDGRPLALVHPGASTAEKRWTAEGFGEVARGLMERGCKVAVTGGEGERALTRRVASLAPGARDLGGRTDLSGLVGLVEAARLLVTNDTGPAHLAYARCTPSVTVFGPSTDRLRWGPPGSGRHEVLVGDPIGSVSVDDVLAAAGSVAGLAREKVGA
jgi:ADP-heptose:LPS heptosyltransferase